MSSPEELRYTHETTGESTDHARQVAESTQTELDQLATSVKNAIPSKNTLNMAEHVVKKGESVTAVIKSKLANAKYNNKRLVLLSYAHMFKQADQAGENINLINAGDKLSIVNGKLTVTRTAKGTSFEVDLYPWPATSGPKPAPPQPEEPEDTDEPEPEPIEPEDTDEPEPEPIEPEDTDEPEEPEEPEAPELSGTPDEIIERSISTSHIRQLEFNFDEMNTWEMDENPEHTSTGNPFYVDGTNIKFEKASWLPDPVVAILLKKNIDHTELISAMNKKWQNEHTN